MVVVLVPENQSFYTHVRDICSRSPGPVAESLVWEMPTPGGSPEPPGSSVLGWSQVRTSSRAETPQPNTEGPGLPRSGQPGQGGGLT